MPLCSGLANVTGFDMVLNATGCKLGACGVFSAPSSEWALIVVVTADPASHCAILTAGFWN